MDEQAINDVVERLRNRFYGKYRGTVTAVDAATMRIKAKVPAVLKDQESGWCMPCVPYAGDKVGFAFLPEVKAGVWIEFEAGDVSMPIWTGCYWREKEAPPDAAPTVKAIVTQAFKLVVDDDGGSLTLSDADEEATVTVESSGITLECGGGKVEVAGGKVALNDDASEVQ